MSNSTHDDDIIIVFRGEQQNLEEALAAVNRELGRFGEQATRAGDTAGSKLAGGEGRAASAAKEMAEKVRVSAEAASLLGRESSETTVKLFAMSDAAARMTGSFKSFSGALMAGMAGAAAFGALDFAKSSAEEALAGEANWKKLEAAYSRAPGMFGKVKAQIEDTRQAWEKYHMTQSEVAGMVAGAAGAGVSAATILGNPKAIADLGVALREGPGLAVQDLTHGARGLQMVLSRLNLPAWQQQMYMRQARTMTADQRVQLATGLVENSGFAGQADAQTTSVTGKIQTLQTAMKDFKEEAGNAFLPAMASMATAATGVLAGIDGLTRQFGGLGNVLQHAWLPILLGGVAGFITLRAVLGAVEELIRGKLVSTFGQTTAAVGDADKGVRQLTDDLATIPKDVTTTAAFVATAASTAKDLYLGNINRIPGAIVPGLTNVGSVSTVAAFDATAATAEVTAYEGKLAAASTPVTTTANFVGGAVPMIAAITVTSVLMSSGAMKGITSTLGNLTGHVKHWSMVQLGQLGNLTGHIKMWTMTKLGQLGNLSAHIAHWSMANVPGLSNLTGHIGRWTHVAVTGLSNLTGHIGQWTRVQFTMLDHLTAHIGSWAHAPFTLLDNLTGHVQHWDTKKAPHIPGTVDVQHINTPKTVTINHGTATITTLNVPQGVVLNTPKNLSATITRLSVPPNAVLSVGNTPVVMSHISVPKGTTISINGDALVGGVQLTHGKTFTIGSATIKSATVNNVTVPHGKTLTISGAQLDNVTLKPGTKFTVTGGSATVNVVHAKKVAFNPGAIGSALGGSVKTAMPFYIKYVPINTPPNTGTAHSGGPGGAGGGGFDLGGTVLQAAIFGVVGTLAGALVQKFGGAGIDMVKDIFKKKPPTGPPSGGGGGSGDDIGQQLDWIQQQAKGQLAKWSQQQKKADAIQRMRDDPLGQLFGPPDVTRQLPVPYTPPLPTGNANAKLGPDIVSMVGGAFSWAGSNLGKIGAAAGMAGGIALLVGGALKVAASGGIRVLGGAEGAIAGLFAVLFGGIQKQFEKNKSGGPALSIITSLAGVVGSWMEGAVTLLAKSGPPSGGGNSHVGDPKYGHWVNSGRGGRTWDPNPPKPPGGGGGHGHGFSTAGNWGFTPQGQHALAAAAARINHPAHPPGHPAHHGGHPAPGHVTVYNTIHINGAQHPHQVRKEVEAALGEFVDGMRHHRRTR